MEKYCGYPVWANTGRNKKNTRVSGKWVGAGKRKEAGWLRGGDIAQKPPTADPIYRWSQPSYALRSTDVSMSTPAKNDGR